MAMVLQSSRLRLTQAIRFGHPGGGGGAVSITGANGILMTPSPLTGAGTARLTTLTSDWNAGNKNINSHNSVDYVNVRAYGAVGDGIADDTAAIQAAITASPIGSTIYFPVGVYLVNGLTGGDYRTFLGPTMQFGAVLKTATRVFDVTSLKQTQFRHLGFTGTGFLVGTALGSSSVITGDGCEAVTIENCSFNSMDYAIDMPMVLSSIIGCTFGSTAVRLPGGAGASNNINIFERNIFQFDTGKAFTLVIGTAAGGSQPQGGQAGSNIIRDNDFETNSGGVIQLNGAGATLIERNWFENNNLSVGTSIIQALVSGGVNNLLVVRGNNFAGSATLSTSVIEHSAGATLEFVDNQGTAGFTNYSTGTINRVAGNYHFPAPLMATYPPETNMCSQFAATDTSGGVVSISTGTTNGSSVYYNALHTTGANQRWGYGFDSSTGWGVFRGSDGAGVTRPDLYISGNGIDVLTVDGSGRLGVNETDPTRTLDLNGTQRIRGIVAPAVSEANSATIYFDSTSNTLKASLNGSAYVNVIGSAGLTGSGVAGKLAYWSAASVLTDEPNVTLGGTYALDVAGDINITTGSAIRVNAINTLRYDTVNGTIIIGSAGVTGIRSVSVGTAALGGSTGQYNTGVGYDAGQNLTTGLETTAIGALSLQATVAGDHNTALGYSAGVTNTTGSNNVLLGHSADVAAGNLTNAVAIGYQASVAANDSMQLGNASMKVGIRAGGTPHTALDVGGQVSHRMGTVAVANGLNSDIATPDSSYVRLTGPSAVFSVGGFAGGFDGNLLTIYNTVAFQMTIVNEDVSSTALNRIKTLTGGNVVLRAGTSSATFHYDTTDDRWVLTSQN
jgi:Pectate lyase superfamily protein